MKYTKELLAPIIARSISMQGVMRELGLRHSGGSNSHLKRVARKFGLSTQHFRGQASNYGVNRKGGLQRLTPQSILVLKDEFSRRTPGHLLRRALLESGVKDCCSICGLVEWLGKKVLLIPDHENGKFWDNRIQNLRLLCPNCHSQTPTFAGRNLKFNTGVVEQPDTAVLETAA